jgi:hypothetical protein
VGREERARVRQTMLPLPLLEDVPQEVDERKRKARLTQELKPADADDPERSSVDGLNAADYDETRWVCVGASTGGDG